MLKAALDNLGVAVYTVTYDSSRGKFVITRADLLNFQLAIQGTSDSDKDVARYLGLEQDGSYTFYTSTTSSAQRVNLQRYDVIYLNCSLANNNGNERLAELFLSGTGNSDVLEFQPADSCMNARALADNLTNQVNMSITDRNNKNIDMNGLEWRCAIALYDDRIQTRC